MGFSQKASNLLADALYSFDAQIQIGVLRRRATSGVEFGNNCDAIVVARLASKIVYIAHDAEVSTYRATP
jgi:hypothetical protein